MANVSRKNAMIFGVTISALLIICIFVFITINFISASGYNKINIFADIQECSVLNKCITDRKISDKYIDNLSFVDSYVHEVALEKASFVIYAYEFDSVETTKQYFSQIKGKTVDGDIDYKSNSSLFSSKLIVRYKNNVLRIETGGTQEYINVLKFLNSIFSVNIRG